MQVTFVKKGDRHYGITIERGPGDVVYMLHGPGFDLWLPHDLVHFMVERHFGIAGAVFGQIAAGGSAGTFISSGHGGRDPNRKLSDRLGALGREDSARSERLAGACMAAWHQRRGNRWRHAETVRPEDATAVTHELVDHLDEVAERWHAVPVGGSLTLPWPTNLQAARAGGRQGRRQNRDRKVAARGR